MEQAPTKFRAEARARHDEANDHGGRLRSARQAGLERRVTEPDLQVKAEDQREAEHAGEEREAGDQPAGERALREKAGRHERIAATVGDAPGPPTEAGEADHRQAHSHERPGRPAEIAPLDERVDDQECRDGHDEDAAIVHARRVRAPRTRQELDRAEHGGQPERQVDHEDHPPAPAEVVRADQPAGQDRSAHGRQTHHRAEGTERGGQLLVAEHLLHHAEALRQHHRTEQSLDDSSRDQHFRILCHSAGKRCDNESARADHEHAFAAVQVAEAPAGNETDCHRERVPGSEPLDHALAAVQLRADRRTSDRRDERIQEIHHLRGEDDGQGPPAPAVRRAGGRAVDGRVVTGGAGVGCFDRCRHRDPRVLSRLANTVRLTRTPYSGRTAFV